MLALSARPGDNSESCSTGARKVPVGYGPSRGQSPRAPDLILHQALSPSHLTYLHLLSMSQLPLHCSAQVVAWAAPPAGSRPLTPSSLRASVVLLNGTLWGSGRSTKVQTQGDSEEVI